MVKNRISKLKLSPNIPMKTSIIKIQNKTCEVGP